MRCYLGRVKQKKYSLQQIILGALMGYFVLSDVACGKSNVYKQVMPDGHIEYSDHPSQASSEVILPQIQINPHVPPATPIIDTVNTANTADSTQLKQEQVIIRIASPMDQQVFTSNITEVPVELFVQPELGATQKIKIFLDNQPYGEAQQASSFVLTDLERGTHELKAMVMENNHQILATSAPVSFHQQRQIVRKK